MGGVVTPQRKSVRFHSQCKVMMKIFCLDQEKNQIINKTSWATHLFCPIAIETSGVIGPDTTAKLHDLASQIKDVSSEPNSKAYLFKKILLRCRVAMQHLSWSVPI